VYGLNARYTYIFWFGSSPFHVIEWNDHGWHSSQSALARKNTILNEVQAQFAGFGKSLHWASLNFSWVCNGSLPSQISSQKSGNLGDLESTDANYRPEFSIFAKSSGGPYAG
jgi:hypothetical protein